MSRVDVVLSLPLRRLLLVSICLALLATVSGCGGGSGFVGLADPVTDDPDPVAGDNEDPDLSTTTTTTTIGQDGGTATSDDGSLTLTFPAGALSMDTEITIERREVSEVPELFGDAPIVAYYELGPSDLTFDLPVEVVVQGLGNPVLGPGTLGTPLFLLATEAGGAPEFLEDLRVIVDATGAAASIAASGELSHFSPLLATRAQIESFNHVALSGIPEQALLGQVYPIRIDAVTLDVEETFACMLDETAPFFRAVGGPVCDDVRVASEGGIRFTGDAPPEEVALLEDPDQRFALAIPNFECLASDDSFLEVGVRIAVPPDLGPVYFPTAGTPLGLLVEMRSGVPCRQNAGGGVPEISAIELTEGVTALPNGRTNPEAFTLLVRNEESGSSSVDDRCFINVESCSFVGVMGTDSGYIGINLATGSSEFATEGGQSFGATVVGRPPQSGTAQAAVVLDFGPGGSFRQNYDDESGTFGPGGFIGFDRHTDAVSACGDDLICDEMLVVNDGRVRFIHYDSSFDVYESGETLSLNRYSGSAPLSVAGREPGGSLLVLTSNSLCLEDRAGVEAVSCQELTGDPRKIRCDAEGEICAISLFAEDAILPVIWDSVGAPVLGTAVPVGDGPVGIHVETDPDSGEVTIVSTGFNDDTVTRVTLADDGTVLFNTTVAVPEGCSQPGHARLLPEFLAEEGRSGAIGTCFGSAAVFVKYFD